jgi:hypothetical protein
MHMWSTGELKEEGVPCNTRRKGELKWISPVCNGEKNSSGVVCARGGASIRGMVLQYGEL